MDVSKIVLLFPYVIAGIGVVATGVISATVWFIKRILDDNKSLKDELQLFKQVCDNRYEGLQADNTKIKLELEHVHSQLDITTSELHAMHIQNNLEHAEFYDRHLKTELSHVELVTEHNCFAKEVHNK